MTEITTYDEFKGLNTEDQRMPQQGKAVIHAAAKALRGEK